MCASRPVLLAFRKLSVNIGIISHVVDPPSMPNPIDAVSGSCTVLNIIAKATVIVDATVKNAVSDSIAKKATRREKTFLGLTLLIVTIRK